jgi:hypothetical protein
MSYSCSEYKHANVLTANDLAGSALIKSALIGSASIKSALIGSASIKSALAGGLKGLGKNPYGCSNGNKPGDRARSSIIH